MGAVGVHGRRRPNYLGFERRRRAHAGPAMSSLAGRMSCRPHRALVDSLAPLDTVNVGGCIMTRLCSALAAASVALLPGLSYAGQVFTTAFVAAQSSTWIAGGLNQPATNLTRTGNGITIADHSGVGT